MIKIQFFIFAILLVLVITLNTEIDRLKILTKTPIQYEKIHEPLYRIKK